MNPWHTIAQPHLGTIEGRPHHVTASFAIRYILWCRGKQITLDQFRQWCSRGHVTRVGTDPAGYALYDLIDVVEHAKKRGMLASE